MADYKFAFKDLYDFINDGRVVPGKDLMVGFANLGIFVYDGKNQVNIIKADRNGMSLSICNITFSSDERDEKDGSFPVQVFECHRDGYCDYDNPIVVRSSDVISDLSDDLWSKIRYGKTAEGVLTMMLAQHTILKYLRNQL